VAVISGNEEPFLAPPGPGKYSEIEIYAQRQRAVIRLFFTIPTMNNLAKSKVAIRVSYSNFFGIDLWSVFRKKYFMLVFQDTFSLFAISNQENTD
jgi:hypothetical protein